MRKIKLSFSSNQFYVREPLYYGEDEYLSEMEEEENEIYSELLKTEVKYCRKTLQRWQLPKTHKQYLPLGLYEASYEKYRDERCKLWVETFKGFAEPMIPGVKIKMTGCGSPTAYNYCPADWCNFDMTFDAKVGEGIADAVCCGRKDQFSDWLEEECQSYPGYISFPPKDIVSVVHEIYLYDFDKIPLDKELMSGINLAWGRMLSFYLFAGDQASAFDGIFIEKVQSARFDYGTFTEKCLKFIPDRKVEDYCRPTWYDTELLHKESEVYS